MRFSHQMQHWNLDQCSMVDDPLEIESGRVICQIVPLLVEGRLRRVIGQFFSSLYYTLLGTVGKDDDDLIYQLGVSNVPLCCTLTVGALGIYCTVVTWPEDGVSSSLLSKPRIICEPSD